MSGKGWSDNSQAGVAVPISKGNRLILLHAGGEMGFIDNCLIMWKANIKTGDYHDNMNHTNYIKWMTEQLIPNLPPKSFEVVNNASYHNVEINKSPTSNTKKADMQAWLQEKNIPFSPTMLKVELYDIIKSHKPTHKRYVIDELLQKHEHDIIRLPPYHPELNAIELIWAEVKNWVGAHNVTFNIGDVEGLARQKFEAMSSVEWQKKCENVKNIEKGFMRNQGLLEDTIESFIINLGGESSEEEDTDGTGDSEMSDGNLSGFEELH